MHSPRKRFGQHFLHDQRVIERIVAALNPKKTEHLVEIGPGQGALTFPVLKKVDELDAIELDRDLIESLSLRSKTIGKLNLYSGDVLEFNFAELKNDERPLRIFGNLPYNISTPLIFHLLDFSTLISDMLFMLQKEVAHRLSAAPDTEDYGRLSVMVQYHCEVKLLFDVSPNAFYPPPQVISSIVMLNPYQKKPAIAKNYDLFSTIVREAFGKRRKTLRNSLKDYINDEAWSHIEIHSDLRPENLSVKDFVMISNAIGENI